MRPSTGSRWRESKRAETLKNAITNAGGPNATAGEGNRDFWDPLRLRCGWLGLSCGWLLGLRRGCLVWIEIQLGGLIDLTLF